MSAIEALPPEDVNVVFVAMLTTSRAVDLFLGDLTRRSRSRSGRTADSYRRLLDKFTDSLRTDEDVTGITPDDCRRFLDRYARHAPGYQHTIYATLNSFLEWLYQQQRIKKNPLDHVARPKRIAAEDLDVLTVATVDVPKLLAACQNWSEKLAVAIPAYLGPTRHACALLRLRDYDREQRTIRFGEKGSKTIKKPVPAELGRLLNSAIDAGAIVDPDDYLIPTEGYLVRKGDRDDRVVWRLIKRVGQRAGVDVTVHALRAAFATFYLESNPNDLVGLQELMGHRSIETTKVYLRKLDKQRSMENVRTLSWAAVGTGNIDQALSSQIATIRFKSSPSSGGGRIRTSVRGDSASQDGWKATS